MFASGVMAQAGQICGPRKTDELIIQHVISTTDPDTRNPRAFRTDNTGMDNE